MSEASAEIGPLVGAKQSRALSFLEATTNVVVGYLLAVIVQMLAFPLFGLMVTLTDSLAIGAIFTVVSLARSFLLRRLFEEIRTREALRNHS